MEETDVTRNKGILEGIRVLDFGRYVAGPYCATLLGYLGAEVIRIEKRDGGEDRYIAPVMESGEGGVFLQTSCNKKSITLNPRHAKAQEIIEALVKSADVVVANLTEQALQKFGISYEQLVALKPDIILSTQTAFGERGPWAGKGGFDGVGQAMSGAAYMSGIEGEPVKAAAPYVDYSTAVMSAFGVMAALFEREKTGKGQQVEASLLSTALSVFNSHLVEQSVTRIDRSPSGNRVQTSAPSDVFACADGHILVHVVGNGLFKRCAQLIGADEWLADSGLQTDQDRGDRRDELCQRMAEWIKAQTQEEALSALEKAGVPAGPVLNLQQALDHPQVKAMNCLKEVDYPGLANSARVSDLPLNFSRNPGGIHQRPPQLGEHSVEILSSLGFTDEQVKQFRKEGVI